MWKFYHKTVSAKWPKSLVENIFLNSSNANTAFITFDDKNITVQRQTNWPDVYLHYSVSYLDRPIPIFQVRIFWDKTKKSLNILNSIASISFYWAFFTLLDRDFFSSSISSIFDWYKYTRLDFRIDFLNCIPVLKYDHFLTLREKSSLKKWEKAREYIEWKELISWDCWATKNEYLKVRMYNKKRQIQDTEKDFYNSFILKQKSYTRLEFEMWTIFLQKYNFLTLQHAIEFFTNFYCWVFDPRQDDTWKKNEKLINDDLIFEHSSKMFFAYWEKIIDRGYNPYILLHNHLCKKDKKITSLSAVNDFFNSVKK